MQLGSYNSSAGGWNVSGVPSDGPGTMPGAPDGSLTYNTTTGNGVWTPSSAPAATVQTGTTAANTVTVPTGNATATSSATSAAGGAKSVIFNNYGTINMPPTTPTTGTTQ